MTIYALMFAVSEYPEGISNLPGCKEDLAALEQYFAAYAKLNEVDFKPITLLNETATRAGVIEAFAHFDQAGPEDICLLYFSGHGAQMPAPPEFWDEETDRKCEAMVLHDSRLPGGRDLADKELSYLLATHTKQAGQVLAIVDSCHSGTITRMASALPRSVAANPTSTSLQDFLGWETYTKDGQYYHPPVRDHVTLSACRPEQLAMEMPMNGVRHGLFTWFLIETMNSVDLASCSYNDLIAQVRVRVKNHYRKQDVLAVATGSASLSQQFLSGKLSRSRAHVMHYDKKAGYFIDRGVLNGIEKEAKGVVLDGEEEKEITVYRVEPGRSIIRPEPWMSPDDAPYPLVSLEEQNEPLCIYLDDSLSAIIKAALTNEIKRESATLILTDSPDEATYHIALLKNYGVSMVLPGEERPLFEAVPKAYDGWAVEFVEKLSKVATYEKTLKLAPKQRILDLDKVVDLDLEQVYFDPYGDELPAEKRPTDGKAVFSYTADEDGNLNAPLLRLKVKVKANYVGSLHVAMLYLNESFGVSAQAMPVAMLSATDEAYSTRITVEDEDGTNQYFNYVQINLPDKLQSWGLTESTVHLKLIVSETAFETDGFEQEGLEIQAKLEEENNFRNMTPPTIFRKQRRDRWGVKNIPITIYRPLRADGSVQLYGATDSTAPVQVANAPEGFSFGEIMLDSSLSTTRALSEDTAPPCPTEGYLMAPASLVSSRSMAAAETPLDMVQLFGVSNEDKVSEANPLRLKAASVAEDGALVMAYDEESGRYFPVGFPDPESGELVVQHLPKPVPEQYTRSLGGSIKLFFRKVVSDYLPWPVGQLNKLRRIEIGEDFTVSYVSNNAAIIKESVTKAKKPIALFIHGIIGDTTTAPAILRRAKMPDGSPVTDQYDVVLTYDYENLKTPLLETAQDLQKQLQDVGLGSGHGKTFHIYAHSMGGLVSRCFIEILHGKQIVSHLLQFGTPNGGSPYGNAAQWMTPLLSRALAAGAAYSVYLAPLLGLRWFINNALETLKQMKIGSDFLKMLEDKGDRGDVPYSLVNGDIRLIPDVTEEDMSFFRRITAKYDWKDGLDLVFFQAPTDVAVSVKSQQQIPAITGLHEAIGSDHMSYFINAAAIKVYEGYLPRLFPE
ncbi:MAG: caspase family protein [Bacteroidota bacterium]